MSLHVAAIEVEPAVVAPLDPEFLPAALFTREYRKLVAASREMPGGIPLRLALKRGKRPVQRRLVKRSQIRYRFVRHVQSAG